MALTVTAKVTGVKSLAEARFCAGMGVEILTFDLSSNGLPLEEAAGIVGWLAGVKICLDANDQDMDSLNRSIEFLQPSYISINEVEANHMLGKLETGIIIQLQDSNLFDVQRKIDQYKNSVEYIEITFHPEWISDENEGLFTEITNDARVMVSIPSLSELDELFRTGKIFRSINIHKPDFIEDDFRQTIEMFEDMD